MKGSRILIVALACAIGAPPACHSTRSDTSVRRISLSSEPCDCGTGRGPEPALVAEITSTSARDSAWKITWYRTPDGEREQIYGAASAPRDGGASGVLGAIALTGLDSGDRIRAHHEARDAAGTVLFARDRRTVVP